MNKELKEMRLVKWSDRYCDNKEFLNMLQLIAMNHSHKAELKAEKYTLTYAIDLYKKKIDRIKDKIDELHNTKKVEKSA